VVLLVADGPHLGEPHVAQSALLVGEAWLVVGGWWWVLVHGALQCWGRGGGQALLLVARGRMCAMAPVWIESAHNLHCPTCDARLVEQAARIDVLNEVRGGPTHPKYQVDGDSLTCPSGHQLPSVDDLYAYRDEQGHDASDGPVVEVRAPR
jgi:hypothetical protein